MGNPSRQEGQNVEECKLGGCPTGENNYTQDWKFKQIRNSTHGESMFTFGGGWP